MWDIELVEGWVGGNPIPFHEASKEVCLKDSAKDCMTVEISLIFSVGNIFFLLSVLYS